MNLCFTTEAQKHRRHLTKTFIINVVKSDLLHQKRTFNHHKAQMTLLILPLLLRMTSYRLCASVVHSILESYA
jgi:hypothetical protein